MLMVQCVAFIVILGIKCREAVIRKEAISFGVPHQHPNILDQVSWDYRPVREVVDYLCEHSLIGPVIEYSYYSKKVGWKNEQIVIWEIRNY